ncbi:MAG: molecular chaperone [Rhodocyclaceae bacterium]
MIATTVMTAMTTRADAALDAARAEFYLCLAHAFGPPGRPGVFEALRDVLADDLAELAGRCGYDVAAPLAQLRAAMTSVQPDALQVCYARLFLVPGDPHPSLNTGVYIDGALGGGSVHAMEACYARCGLEKHSGFLDLPDHVSVQLEFVAWLFATTAGLDEAGRAGEEAGERSVPMRAEDFIDAFVARWVGTLRGEIDAASERFSLGYHPYAALVRVLERAVACECARRERPALPAADGTDPEIVRLRAEFAGRMMTEQDLAVIRARLEADGLTAEHVAIPIDARDRVMGLASMVPPSTTARRALLTGGRSSE